VQADPIKPMLKAPGTERLKLKHEKLLSNFGFKFNLRRYTQVISINALDNKIVDGTLAGAYTGPLFSSS